MKRRRRLWMFLLAAPLVLLAAHTLYWRLAVDRLSDGFKTWMAQQRAAGWTEHYGTEVQGGWPLAATVTVPAMSMAGGQPDIPGGLSWSADRVVLRVALVRPSRLDIAAAGQQLLRLAGEAEVHYTADRLRLVVPLWGGARSASADFTADNVRADVPGGEASVELVRLHLEILPPAQSGESAIGFRLRAEGIGPPAGMMRPLGPRIATLALEGALNGPVATGQTLAERAAAWRDGGGSLELQHLALVWGPLDLTGSATLALDDQLQPMGTGSARMVGYAETLDALAAHAVISRSAAIPAKAVLSLLARTPDDGGPPDVEVPLTLQFRTLSMRQVPLVRLPEVDWP